MPDAGGGRQMDSDWQASRLLFPLDGSLMAEQSVYYLRGILAGSSVHIRLLTVLPPTGSRSLAFGTWRLMLTQLVGGGPPNVTFMDERQASEYLERLAARLRGLG